MECTNSELQARKLELFISLKQTIIDHWDFQNFDQDFFTGVEEYQEFVDYFKY